VVELDEEELDEGITTGMCVNPEWDSSHAYRSAKTYSCIGIKESKI
jgi:hypothetical protein